MRIINTPAFVLFLAAISFPARAAFVQQGDKLVGTGTAGSTSRQGYSVAVSADGNTALIGGHSDNNLVGAAWVFTRSGGLWSQQGGKLVGTGGTSQSQQGLSVAISADGNTAMVGGFSGAWAFTRSAGVWTQQGPKLLGTGNLGGDQAVALSADGNTALLGSLFDSNSTGATWVFTRSGGVWTQQGNKLVGTGAIGPAEQGFSVALSADGNSALIGGQRDNSYIGAAWVFTRSAGVWTQQGEKLVGAGNVGEAAQAFRVALSGDGNTALLGGSADNANRGAAWVFTQSGGVWTQQGPKLVGSGAVGNSEMGTVALSFDGNKALMGGFGDNSGTGATWVFTRSGGTWTQQGEKLLVTGNVGAPNQGTSVSLSADGTTALVGGFSDGNVGATWVFAAQTANHFSLNTPSSATAGKSFSITITARDNTNATVPDYAGTVHFSSTDAAGGLPADYTFVPADLGTHTFTVTLNSAGSATVSATDLSAATLTGTSSTIVVNPAVAVSPSTLPDGTLNQPGYSQTVSATGGTGALTLSQSGTLPAGLTFAPASGTISGTPTVLGTFSFTITATDALGASGSKAYSVAIKNPNITTLMSGPSAAPSPGVVLQSISFSAAAANANSEPLAYNWAFGDGTQAAGASVAHVYASPATYTVTLTVTSSAPTVTASIQATINPRIATVGTGADSDGDGFSDALEGSAGSDPADPESTPTGDPADPGTPDVLTVTKAAVKLNFAKPGNDSISAAGTVDVPAGFISSGAKVYLDVGGVIKGFVLTASGSAGNKTETIKIAVKSKKGVVAAQTAKFTASFKKGSFAETLASSGLTDSTAKNAPVVLPFTFIFNNSVLQTNLPMSYTAKPGKTGAAK